MAPETVHLRPTAPVAERVLLPGDPGRALALAQVLLDEPRMLNHNRGLWGYTGTASDGHLLSIQSTGMGGPSAAIVVSELIELGARRLVRVGTCGSLAGLALGQLVVAGQALCGDGTSRALAGVDRVAADPALCAALARAAPTAPSTVVSTDLFYDHREGLEQEWLAAGAVAVEMEAATLLALGARHEVAAGAVLIVSDRVLPSRARITPEALREAEVRAGQVALAGVA